MLPAPVIGIVGDQGVLVLCDLISFQDPVNGGFAVEDIIVCFGRNVLNLDVFVEKDPVFFSFLGPIFRLPSKCRQERAARLRKAICMLGFSY